jgi:surface antigen
MKTTVTLLLAGLLLTGCTMSANDPRLEGNKGKVGAAGGAAAGALIGQVIGHNTESTLIGTAAGALLGYIVGNEMDKYDRRELNHVYERGVSNQPTAWVNPDTGNQYTVTPTPAYTRPGSSQPCRDAEIRAMVNGEEKITRTTACRQPDGSWVLQ